jgi:hypothetical protein
MEEEVAYNLLTDLDELKTQKAKIIEKYSQLEYRDCKSTQRKISFDEALAETIKIRRLGSVPDSAFIYLESFDFYISGYLAREEEFYGEAQIPLPSFSQVRKNLCNRLKSTFKKERQCLK